MNLNPHLCYCCVTGGFLFEYKTCDVKRDLSYFSTTPATPKVPLSITKQPFGKPRFDWVYQLIQCLNCQSVSMKNKSRKFSKGVSGWICRPIETDGSKSLESRSKRKKVENTVLFYILAAWPAFAGPLASQKAPPPGPP